MPTSTQRFRLVGEDDASRAFLQVAAAAKLLNSNMSDAGTAALGLTKLIGGAGLIPVAAGAAAAVTELGTALGAAGGAMGVFGISAAGTLAGMVKAQKSIAVAEKSLAGLTKGTKAYRAEAVKVHALQQSFQSDYGKAAKGYDSMTASWQKFLHATGPVTQGVLGKGFQLVADVLPKLVPVSNAAGKAVGGLIDDLSNWTKGPGFASLLHFLETSGPKDITAFGHIVGNTVSGLAGILGNFVGPGNQAAKALEHLTANFDKWGHSKGVSDSVNSFLKYVSDNGPEISSVFKSLAESAPKFASALGGIGGFNLKITSKFLELVAGLPPKQFNLIADGLFAMAAGAKAFGAIKGLVGGGAALIALAKGSKGIIGKSIGGGAAGALGGKSVVPVYVTNKGFGGPGGGSDPVPGWLKKWAGPATVGGAEVSTATIATVAVAAVAALGLTAYIGYIQRNIKPYGDHTADPGTARGGRAAQQQSGTPAGPAEGRHQSGGTALSRGFSPVRDAVTGYGGLKSLATNLANIHVQAERASRSIEEIGPHGENASKTAVHALQALSGHTTGLDSVKAHAADASRSIDLIGPHGAAAAHLAENAVRSLNHNGLDAVHQHAADASRSLDLIGPTAARSIHTAQNAADALNAHLDQAARNRTADVFVNDSAALAQIAHLQYAVDQLHGKTVIIRAIGGHVTDNSQIGGGSGGGAAGSSSGGGASTGKSFDARSGQAAGVDYMTGLLKGIASKSMSVQNAISKVANALSSIKSKVGNLQGVRAGFRSTFGSDSIFGQDFSHTGPSGATINGVAPSGPDVTTPGTIADVLAFQKAQRDRARSLNHDIKKLEHMGLSKALIKQLRSQGAAGAATLHILAQGTRAQIQQENQLNKQTSQSLRQAGMRAGNYDRGGSIAADIRSAKKTEHALQLLEHRLKDLDHTLKKGQTINVVIDGEAVVTAIVRRNKRKGVKTAGV